MNAEPEMTAGRDKSAVIGALALYLDFINLFLFFLRIFGGGAEPGPLPRAPWSSRPRPRRSGTS